MIAIAPHHLIYIPTLFIRFLDIIKTGVGLLLFLSMLLVMRRPDFRIKANIVPTPFYIIIAFQREQVSK